MVKVGGQAQGAISQTSDAIRVLEVEHVYRRRNMLKHFTVTVGQTTKRLCETDNAMDKYRRKTVGEELKAEAAQNELLISSQGKVRTYVNNALSMLQNETFDSVVITGRGNTINKAVTVTEIVKRRLDNKLRQETEIFNIEATDIWEPVEDDLDRLLVTRYVPAIRLRLFSTRRSEATES
ncbi:hypothetical protein BC832DRAFT_592261 [Gaertneriomyces semiglobifer]|nr:hypothetical protein BC832DRAFT_592261 [Gaertneriomyces semiglobifer]